MKYPTEFNNVDFELYFLTEILKLYSLHYGYWEGDEDLNLENFRKAQARYTKTLIELIPWGIRSILDVGSGIGDLSRELVKRGYQITALSPDKNHKKYYDDGEVDFYNTKFEDFVTSKKFDLIIMSESSGYFDYRMALPKCKVLLKDKGYFINSGFFRKKDEKIFLNISDPYDDYIELALKVGFKKVTEIDISSQTLPTLEYWRKCYQEHVLPTIEMIKLYLYHSAPLKIKTIAFLFKRQLKELEGIQKFYEERFDHRKFTENIRYVRLVFQNISPV